MAQWLELRWWKRYLRNKDRHGYLEWKKAYWKDFLSRLTSLPPLTNKVILDAGCGPAGIFMVLEGNKINASDPLLEKYAQEIDHFLPEDYPWVHFANRSIEQMEEIGEYDVVFCLNAINHVSDIQSSIQKLAKAAKPDATVVISVDAHRHRWLMPIFRLLPGDVLHPHQYDLDGYMAMLSHAGWLVSEKVLFKRESIFDYWVLVCRRPEGHS